MDKMSSIVVALLDPEASDMLVEKARWLADRYGARLRFLASDEGAIRDLRERGVISGMDECETLVTSGASPSIVARIARSVSERPPDLLMIGREEFLVRRLRAASPVPLMLVSDRAWSPERRIAAAIDVSDRHTDGVARSVLQAAGMIALGCEASLDVLYSEREQEDERLRLERAVHFSRLVHEFRVRGEGMRRLEGAPARTLPAEIASRDYDLLVVGASRDGPWLSTLRPTLTLRLVAASAGDVMLVPATIAVAIELPAARPGTQRALGAHP